MINRTWIRGAALVLTAAMALAACSKKAEAQQGSESEESSRASIIESPATDFTYAMTADGRGIRITGYTGEGGDVVIPAKIEDIQVLEIGESAFRGGARTANNRDSITSVVVPAGVERIGSYAFSRIRRLTKVTLPDSVKTIGVAAFGAEPNKPTEFTSINLPASLEEIGSVAFYNCRELTELIIPDSLSRIRWTGADTADNSAFANCQKLPIRTRQRLQELGYIGDF